MAVKRGSRQFPPHPLITGLGPDLRDFDTYASSDDPFGFGAADRAAERLRQMAYTWTHIPDPTPREHAQQAPRRGPPPWERPRCWRCGVELAVRLTPIGNGGKEYEVSCHGETQQVRVPNRELDALKIGYAFAFKPE